MMKYIKEKILRSLDVGSEVSINDFGGLKDFSWSLFMRALPYGSHDLKTVKIRKLCDGKYDMYVSIGGGTQCNIPYSCLSCNAIDVLDKLTGEEIPVGQ